MSIPSFAVDAFLLRKGNTISFLSHSFWDDYQLAFCERFRTLTKNSFLITLNTTILNPAIRTGNQYRRIIHTYKLLSHNQALLTHQK